ncbi:hypothetical protein GA0115235_105215 [Streptomyces sp. DpondAA-F4a]|nr:hypothetical protein GA0115235_105215 [Streptomyces sp. DpondAA-F4a]
MSCGGSPPVDRDADDLCPRLPERIDEAGQGFAVQLEGDPPPFDALAQQPVQDLRHGLRPGRPRLGEPGGPDGALDLGPPGQQFAPAQHLQQPVADAPAVGGLDPAAEPDGGGGDHHVGHVVEQFLGGGEEFAVVRERHDPQRWRVQDRGAPAREERPQLLGATGCGHPDREARERPVLCVVVVHVRDTRLSSRWGRVRTVPIPMVRRNEPANPA